MNAVKNIFYYVVILGISLTGLLFIFFIANFLLTESEHNPAPFGMSTIEVNGTELGYRMRGTVAPSVIIFPAAFGTTAEWESAQRLLGHKRRVVVYDRSGYGISGEPKFPRTKEELASEAMALVRRLEIRPPFILIGDREGTAIALAFASLFRDSIASVIVINPPPHLDSLRAVAGHELFARYFDPLPRLRTNSLLAVFGLRRFLIGIPAKGMANSDEGKRLLRHHYSRLTAYDTAADEIRVNYSGITDPLDVQGFPMSTPLIIVVTSPPMLSEVEAGERDEVTTAWHKGAVELKRRLPRASLVELPVISGSLHLTAPGELSSIVESYSSRRLTGITPNIGK